MEAPPDLTRKLAGNLLSMAEGERLPTVRELATQYGASVGSISNALTTLEEGGLIRITRRGHLGSYLAYRSVGMLWSLAGDGSMVVANPLPSHRRFEGLAGGMKAQLSAAGIQAYMIFMRGSFARIDALRTQKCHAVVMSTFAAKRLCTDREEILLTLPPETYVGRPKLYYREDALNKPVLRVALDRSSCAHLQLTQLGFRDQEVVFVDTNALQIRRQMMEGAIDAAMFVTDEYEYGLLPGVVEMPLPAHVEESIGTTDTSASLVIRSGDSLVREVLLAALDLKALVEFQQSVLMGEIIPDY
jgi:hypothetical protein